MDDYRLSVNRLGLNESSTYQQAYSRFRYLAKKHHPDKGGDVEKFKELYNDWNIIKKELNPNKIKIVTFQYSYRRDVYIRLAFHKDNNPENDVIGFDYKKLSYGYKLVEYEDFNHRWPNIPDEDKTIIEGKYCKVIILPNPTDPKYWEDWQF